MRWLWIMFSILVFTTQLALADPLHIRDFGGLPNGSNTTPALDAAVIASQGLSRPIILFDSGCYTFNTPPQPFTAHIELRGEGVSGTCHGTELHVTYSGDWFLHWISGGTAGGGVRDLVIIADPGVTAWAGIYVDGPGGSAVGPTITGGQRFEHLIISGIHGSWVIPFIVVGARNVHGYDIVTFNGTWALGEVWDCPGCVFLDIQGFPAQFTPTYPYWLFGP